MLICVSESLGNRLSRSIFVFENSRVSVLAKPSSTPAGGAVNVAVPPRARRVAGANLYIKNPTKQIPL